MYVSQKVIDAICVALTAMETCPEEPEGIKASDILIDFINRARKERKRIKTKRKPLSKRQKTGG